MGLMIELSPEEERLLREHADKAGMEPSEMAQAFVSRGQSAAGEASAAKRAESLRRLFAQWEAEDPVTGPEDLLQREQELDAFKAGMNAASLSGRAIFPCTVPWYWMPARRA